MLIHTVKSLRSALNLSASFSWTAGAGVLASALLISPAVAGPTLPTGGQYVAGSGTIAKKTGGLTVNQSSNTGIIDWSSFSVGKGTGVQFNNGSGATLNRVTGGNLSTIAGSLKATGSLYLINPQGVIVAGSGRVISGGTFAASSRDVSSDDFMGGKRLRFTGSSKGNVANAGKITAGGDAILIGNAVSNSGSLSAANGRASLNAGNNVYLAPAGSDGHILVKGGAGNVTNSGTIVAAQAQLNAAGGNVYALSGNNGGIIRATGTSTINGHVWLTSASGSVATAGHVSATNADGSGGNIDVRAANITTSARIDASATSAGHVGGNIRLISADTTKVSGRISANGGAHGKGGFVETSGTHLHVVTGSRVSTDGGTSGTWLIDPNDFTIAASGGDMTGATLSSDLSTTDVEIKSINGATAGHGDIFVNDAVSWSSNHVLTLTAVRNIDFNADVTATGSASGVILNYGKDYSFATGNSLTISGAFAGLAINGASYTLLHSMADMQAINANATALQENYALGQSIDATGTSNWIPIGTNGGSTVGNSGNGFSGIFAGLGNTISNLTINRNASYVGLFGYSSGALRDIGLIGGSLHGSFGDSGMLVAYNARGTISHAYETGDVLDGFHVGGLVGRNQNGKISYSYATGRVNGCSDFTCHSLAGGLVGESNGADISYSYATGFVKGATAGGLVGRVDDGYVRTSYALGAVLAGIKGGLVGYDHYGSIQNAYAIGGVTPARREIVGGLLGRNVGGTITASYWNTDTGGSVAIGDDDNSQSGNVTGLTTAQFQSGLPSGLTSAAWGTGSGLFPYFLWQYPGSAPQSVSGFAYKPGSVTPAALAYVYLLVNGTAMGTTVTLNNGYFYYQLPPGSIPSSDGQVLAYRNHTGGAVLADNANGSVQGLKIFGRELTEMTAASTYSAVAADLATAIGGNSTVQSTVGRLPELFIDATAAQFDIDTAIDMGSGILILSGTDITQSAGITASDLSLEGGKFVLNDASNAFGQVDGDVTSAALTDAHSVTIKSRLTASGIGIKVTTTGPTANKIRIVGRLSATSPTGMVTLISAGNASQSAASAIIAHKLNVTATTGISLTSAHNNIGVLGTDTTTSGPNDVNL